MMRWGAGIEGGLAEAALAAEAAARTDDVALRARTLSARADWEFRAGRGLQRAKMEEALALERSLPGWPLVGGPTEGSCHQLVWAVELDEARKPLLELLDVRRMEQNAGSEAWTMWSLGLLEWRAGNWDEADRYANEALELIAQLGGVSYTDEYPAAIVAAHKGRVDEARARAERSIVRGAAEGIWIEQSGQNWVLGFVHLSLGDGASALGPLRRSYEIRDTFMLEPGQRLELGDLLEALIATGELDEAEDVLTTWEARAEAVDRAWALAIVARCRGLLLAARADLTRAFASFDRALVEHARSADPFHHARTLLALGRTQRRAKKRAAARSTLEDALARFEALGAPFWAEQRIAALVTEGRTNREVALFLTEHSVETALTRVYRKLGVRSRAELTRLRAEGG